MPGLHNGSICWGNRKSFSEFADFHHSPTMRPPSHVSAGTYYGYERVHAVGAPPPDDESMDTTAAPDCDGNEESRRAHARKRQAADLGSERNKRIRQGDIEEKMNSTEEEDILFLEHYLKQTHGCDYYNFKGEYV
ncbi:uncharacterized protein LOC106666154 isoform X1 [Cimex lectularius]|uniref:Uncharacterized protein n=1 Tax=Cimex lectularius TaxID=79782 RepID=A0A8I6RLP4_CIMLE|nr:uncharacterized protein LOC106666154 isoform X1 [Cimex lectularius]